MGISRLLLSRYRLRNLLLILHIPRLICFAVQRNILCREHREKTQRAESLHYNPYQMHALQKRILDLTFQWLWHVRNLWNDSV